MRRLLNLGIIALWLWVFAMSTGEIVGFYFGISWLSAPDGEVLGIFAFEAVVIVLAVASLPKRPLKIEADPFDHFILRPTLGD